MAQLKYLLQQAFERSQAPLGFAPDPAEPMGGYFVLRNSWSGAWGAGNPSPNSKGPEQGYGWISASYIENHLWEMCQL